MQEPNWTSGGVGGEFRRTTTTTKELEVEQGRQRLQRSVTYDLVEGV